MKLKLVNFKTSEFVKTVKAEDLSIVPRVGDMKEFPEGNYKVIEVVLPTPSNGIVDIYLTKE